MSTSPKTFAVNPSEWRLFRLWVALAPVSPELDGKSPPRLTAYRTVGRIGARAYEELREHPLIKLPEPPGTSFGTEKTVKGIIGAFNYTPQIGNTMPHLHVSGHFYSDRMIGHPYSLKPVFSGGVLYNIPDNTSPMRAPDANVLADVAQLKEVIDEALTTALTDVSYNVDKLEYMGVTFGVGGLHFPAASAPAT